MPSLHVVVIPSWYADGRGSGGGYFRDQALALQSAGCRVAMLAPEIYTLRDLRSGQVAEARKGGVIHQDGHQDGDLATYRHARYVRMPRLPYRNALAWSLCGLRLFGDYVRKNGRPDLVHAHSCLNAGVLAALIAARHGVPFVVTEHSTGFAQGRLRWWERDLVRRVIRRAKARIAVSPHLARLLEMQFPGKAWDYVPNILGGEFLAPAAVAPRGNHGPFVFLCAARMATVKSHALLIAAFADAFAGNAEVRLQLAGDGPLRPDLQRLCAARGVAPQVEFLGTLSAASLRFAMEKADAFVLASDVETFGVVVIEAMAAGLPVVCTASGGPDHLIDETNGMLVPVGDGAALRQALARMRHEAGRYDRTAISAEAIRCFGPGAFARDFMKVTAPALSGALP